MTEPTVAGPRQPPPRETYNGAELDMRSPRPGAYDHLKLPSRMGDRLVEPGGPRASLVSPRIAKPVPLEHRVAPPAPPAPPPAVAKALQPRPYVPRAGSVAQRVIDELRRTGGHHLMSDLAQRHQVTRSGLAQFLKPAINAGVLVIHKVGHHDHIALPGYVMPAETRPEPDFVFSSGSVDAITPGHQDRRFWPIEQPAERAPTPHADAAADLQRALGSAQALAEIFVQLERQVLIVAALMGNAIARLSPPPTSPFPTAV